MPRREPQSCAGIAEACKPENHDRHVHAGTRAGKTAGTGQTHHNGEGKRGYGLMLRGTKLDHKVKPPKRGNSFKRMAGTTRLELATSAVTEHSFIVFLNT